MNQDLVALANPFQGTASTPLFSTGNTYPAIAVPHGMTFWSPQTDTGRWFYNHNTLHLQGFRATHQPSPWIGDYGHFTLMPFAGAPTSSPARRASSHRHDQTTAHPHYYKTTLSRYQITTEFTPTDRCAFFRLTYADSADRCIALDTFPGQESHLSISPDQRTLIGYTRANSGGVTGNFACHFILTSDTPIASAGTYTVDGDLQDDRLSLTAPHIGAYLRFAPSTGPVHLRVATSFISLEQARVNLNRELPPDVSFDTIQSNSAATWNTLLSRFHLPTATPDQLITFYSAVYRTLLFPRKLHEYDASNGMVHYSPYTGRVHPGPLYTDNGFWDTYRTVYPLLTIAYPDLLGEILTGFLNAYREGGWLPTWCSPGYRNCMIGTHADAIFADAIVKNVPGFDQNLAYEAIRKNAFTPSDSQAYGRAGLEDYIQFGYLPSDLHDHAAAGTLDHAFGDFCVSQAAKKLGHTQDHDILFKRSQNYRNIYDPQSMFLRGRLADGSFPPNFNPFEWSRDYIEGSAWQHTFSVPHDPEGLAQLMGGPEKLIARLDQFLSLPPIFHVGRYNIEIHEMTEMAQANFAQYAHSNQPVHHILWLYAALGRPEKTTHHVHRVLNELYTPTTLPGDEDNGEMSAWYLLAALGQYPLCPTQPNVQCTPFLSIQLHTP